MSSILTNVGAQVAIQTLNRTTKDLNMVQNRISTGMKVAEAKDNSSYWAIAETMRSDVSALTAINENLNITRNVLNTAYTAASNIVDYIKETKDRLALASAEGVDQDVVRAEIDQLIGNVDVALQSASFNGVNVIDATAAGYVATTTAVLSLSRNGAATAVVSDTFGVADLRAGVHTALAAYGTGGANEVNDTATAQAALAGIETALSAGIAASQTLGSFVKRVEDQYTFTTKLVDALNEGIGTLVDANMEQESARLQALQVQQQLGIQALSIANSAPQQLLRLFQ